MPTTSRYLASIKNLPSIFQKIQNGVPPEKFNHDHLKAIGFSSSNDRAIIPLLKDLGFLTSDGTPTQRYREYRDSARSRTVMGEALRATYPDLFVINENISKNDRAAVIGRFKSIHDSSDVVAETQARTFFGLLELADLSSAGQSPPTVAKKNEDSGETKMEPPSGAPAANGSILNGMPLTYRFEIQLPATKDVDVFRAIFRAMKEELFNG